jgi:outer membrane protein assembly factor BamB
MFRGVNDSLNTIRGRVVLLGISVILAGGLPSQAVDWPVFRGPEHNGVSSETAWLDIWPEQGPAIAWKANVGLGFSSMVVGDGRLFSAGHAGGSDTLYCLDAHTGKEIWKHRYPSNIGAKYYEGGTTGTPTLHGAHVYWLSKWGDLFAFEAATGKILWNKQVQKETRIRVPDWGFTGAPIPYKNLVILNMGEAGVAVDRANGKIAWRSANANAGYSTPLPIKTGDQTLFVLGSSKSYIAIHPDTGREAWRIPWVTEHGVNAADPLVVGDRLFLSTGYGKGAGLFDLTRTPPRTIWTSKVLRTQLSSAVVHQGYIFGMDGDTDDKGPLICIEWSTGKERWSSPNFGTGGLIIGDGKLIVLNSLGELMVAPASPEGFRPTARAQVIGGKCWTAPILANGRIYCRNSVGDIVCVDVRKDNLAFR